MAALLIKVGALLLKTLAKPLSTRFQVGKTEHLVMSQHQQLSLTQAYVMEHPKARRTAINLSQVMHRMEVGITRAAEGKTGKSFVGDMTEEKSLELASKLASEGFVFGVGLVIVAFEYERQRRNDLVKRAKEAAERQAVLEQARQEREMLARENREQTHLIQSLMTRVDVLESDLQQLQEEAVRKSMQPKGMFGGFLGPRAQTAVVGSAKL